MLEQNDEMKLKGKTTSRLASSQKTSLKRENHVTVYNALKDLKACRNEYEIMEQGYRAKLYELLQRGARAAKSIRENDELWEKFENDPFWRKPGKGGATEVQTKLENDVAVRAYIHASRPQRTGQAAREKIRSIAHQAPDERCEDCRPRGDHVPIGEWHREEFAREKFEGEGRFIREEQTTD